MPQLQPVLYECTICCECFDECLHRPQTLVTGEEVCGHTFCSKCIREIQGLANKCPICNVHIKYAITNWFVIDLIKATDGVELDNPCLDIVVSELERVEQCKNDFNRTLLMIEKGNDEYAQQMKTKIDAKLKEAQCQLKSLEYNLMVELLRLKQKFEKHLNENTRFEADLQEKLEFWTKKINSNEYRRDSAKLQSIQNEIQIYLKLMEEKQLDMKQNHVDLKECFRFEEKPVQFGHALLGEFKQCSEERNNQVLLFKFTNGLHMLLNSLWLFICGVYCISCGIVAVFWWLIFVMNQKFGFWEILKNSIYESSTRNYFKSNQPVISKG